MQQRIKSYVLRAGRISPRQQQGLDILLPKYLLSATPWQMDKIFSNNNDVILEIGFGMGASLLQMAQNNPQMNFIGVEVHRAGVGSLAADLHDMQIENVRIAQDDAVMLIDNFILDDSLSGVQIFFPDPWHKARHNKRRLIQEDFIQRLVPKLKKNAFIHCATDWEDYAQQMLSVLNNNSCLRNMSETGNFIARPESRPITKFERRGEKLGHGVWDLMFIKNYFPPNRIINLH